MKSLALPYLRLGKLLLLRARARMLIKPSSPESMPVRFVVGCGRSGTTILGKVISLNPHAKYLSEPYHLWQAIDPRMDVTGLHSSPDDARFFMEADDLTQHAKNRYERLITKAGKQGVHQCVIEKTPHNAGKIGWIEAAEPDAKIVHIVRNGLNVIRSIDRLSTNPTYTIAFKSNYNQWWGTNGAKWKALSKEGSARGYFSDEIDSVRSNAQKGAYEWLVSIGELDRWRDQLGDRLLEITYSQLTSDPGKTCEMIAKHIDIPSPDSWIEQAREMVSAERINKGDDLMLPPCMAQKFNEYQERFGFEGRAISMNSQSS